MSRAREQSGRQRARLRAQVGLRLLAAIPTLFGVVILTFVITRILPGDPAAFFAANPAMSPADIAALRDQLGLDAPLWEQFRLYLAALVHGDLGQSLSTGQPVATELQRRLPASAELTLFAFTLAAGIGLPLGIAAALRPGTLLDGAARLLAALGVALPTFVTGLLLIYLFYFRLGIAPEPIGRLDPFLAEPARVTGFLTLDALLAGDPATAGAALARMLLPAATMALFALAPLLRVTRTAMLGVLGAPFIESARALGLTRRQIVMTYAFRNAAMPVVTTMGLTVSYMLGTSVLVEKVFAWPGIGGFAVDSLIALDYAPLQGFMLVMAAVYIAVNLATDLALGLIDPRAGP